jgi:hypothetical protein
VVIVPPDHPCARLSEINWEALVGMTLLGAEPGTSRLLATFFGDNGHIPQSVHVTGQHGSGKTGRQSRSWHLTGSGSGR